jgi:hypothetical protein
MQSIFDKLGDAKEGNERTEKVPAGTHVLAINKCDLVQTRKHGIGASYTFTAISSTNPDVKPGTTYGEMFFVQHPDGDMASMATGRMRKLVRALMDLDANASADQVKEAGSQLFASDGKTGRGIRVKCGATLSEKKDKNGVPYVHTAYESIEQTDEEIAATRKLIESASFAPVVTASVDKTAEPAKPNMLSRMRG